MKISVFSILKDDIHKPFYEGYIKQCRGLGASLALYDIFNSKISQAQKGTPKEAQKSYTQAFLPYLSTHSFALHPQGKMLDSFEFAKLLADKTEICFFVGGAYGFEDDFLRRMPSISLSPLTFSHQIVKIILCEQIYRGLSINANHPYHK